MKALITGIAGQDGSLLAKNLISRGWTVFGTDTIASLERLTRLYRLGVGNDVRVFKVANEDTRSFENLVRTIRPTHVFLLGARSKTLDSEHNPSELLNANFRQVKKLALCASRFDNPWIFLPSSSEIFAQDGAIKSEHSKIMPNNAYGESKALLLEFGGEMVERGYRYCVGVLFPHESFLRSEYFLVQKLVHTFGLRFENKNSPPVRIGNFDSSRDWSSAVAVVDAMACLAKSFQTGNFLIGSGRSVTISDLIVQIADMFGWQGKFEVLSTIPTFLLDNHDSPLLVADDHRFDQSRSRGAVANVSKLVAIVDRYPIETFEVALDHMRRKYIEAAAIGAEVMTSERQNDE